MEIGGGRRDRTSNAELFRLALCQLELPLQIDLESRNRFALLNRSFADSRVRLLRHRPVEIMVETVGVEPTLTQDRLSHPWRMFRSTMSPKIHKNYQIDLPPCHRPLTHPSGTGSPSPMGMDLDLSLGSFHQCFP